MPAEQQVCYLHVTFKDSEDGNLLKVRYGSNQGLVNMVDALTEQYYQDGKTPVIKVLSREEGDKLLRSLVLTYPLWQDLVDAGMLHPLVFAN